MRYTLQQLGWKDFFASEFAEFESRGFEPGRIAIENRDNYLVLSASGELDAQITGRLIYSAESSADYPKVGDWVAISVIGDEGKAIIHDILPRQTTFSRRASGKRTEMQIIGANLDHVYVVQSLDGDFSPNRLERYLVMIRECGAEPGIILNKSDLAEGLSDKKDAAQDIAGTVPLFVASAKTGDGIDELASAIQPGETIALVGSSGVGKSTIINALVGEERQKTADVREFDAKGRHTTTRRELILLPDGGLIIDTPGMREFQLWSDGGMEEVYDDILDLAAECKFNDCTHTHEVECAVLAAVESGGIPESHYENYLKLQKELDYLASKQDEAARREREEYWKQIHKDVKEMKKHRKKFR